MYGIFFAFSEPTDWTREAEWNSWYSLVQQIDLTKAVGVERPSRHVVVERAGDTTASKYAVLYEFDTESVRRTMIDLLEVALWTIRSGRHIDWHRGSGAGCIGEELGRVEIGAPEARVSSAAQPHGTDYMPPLRDVSMAVHLSSSSPDRDAAVATATAMPGAWRVRWYRRLEPELGAAEYCTIVDLRGDGAGALGAISVGPGDAAYVVREVNREALPPLDVIDYPTDEALFGFVTDGTMDRLFGALGRGLENA